MLKVLLCTISAVSVYIHYRTVRARAIKRGCQLAELELGQQGIVIPASKDVLSGAELATDLYVFWYGDIDLTKSSGGLQELANKLGKRIYVRTNRRIALGKHEYVLRTKDNIATFCPQ